MEVYNRSNLSLLCSNICVLLFILLYCSVKDHIRLRLMESGWTNQVSKFVKNAISKRIENDQAPNTIKFEQLYEDVINKARGENLIIL